MAHPPVVEFQGTFVRPGGDDEELRVTFAIPQTEIPKALPLLTWGKCVLTISVVKESDPMAKGRFVGDRVGT